MKTVKDFVDKWVQDTRLDAGSNIKHPPELDALSKSMNAQQRAALMNLINQQLSVLSSNPAYQGKVEVTCHEINDGQLGTSFSYSDGKADQKPEQAENSQDAVTPERGMQINRDISKIVASRSGLPKKEQAIVSNALTVQVRGGKAEIMIDQSLLNKGKFTPEHLAAINQNLPWKNEGSNRKKSEPMTLSQLENYYATFVTRINRTIR